MGWYRRKKPEEKGTANEYPQDPAGSAFRKIFGASDKHSAPSPPQQHPAHGRNTHKRGPCTSEDHSHGPGTRELRNTQSPNRRATRTRGTGTRGGYAHEFSVLRVQSPGFRVTDARKLFCDFAWWQRLIGLCLMGAMFRLTDPLAPQRLVTDSWLLVLTPGRHSSVFHTVSVQSAYSVAVSWLKLWSVNDFLHES